MRLPSIVRLGVAALATFAAGACRQLENPGKIAPGSPTVDETRSAELQRNQLDDVPVPRDMTLVTRANQSFSYAGGGVRVGRYRYVGPVPPEEVVAFYRENMPLEAYGWTPASETHDGGRNHLTFQKNGDRCDVHVSREDGATVLLLLVNCEPLKTP